MELFWRQGFEATTMAELVEHLGIGRASLYATFGDKHELFLQALQHYLRVRRPDPVEAVSQPGPVLPAVRGLVRAYVDEALADPLQQGCMIVNSAGELLPGDTAVARIVESG